jgi:hypothetical protein
MTESEVVVLRSLAEVAEIFLRLAATLRSVPGVRSVTQPIWMRAEDRLGEDQFRVGSGPGFRIEWYAEAEFVGGRAISFGQELSWHDGEWTIDASVRANDPQGEHPVLDFPRRTAVTPDELVIELRGQARLLLERQAEGMQFFLGHTPLPP